jgi:hypothetical protein
VKIRDDAVTLFVAAAETERITLGETSQDLRYVGVIDFEFDRHALPRLGADSVLRAIAATLRPVDAEPAAAPAAGAAPAAPAAAKPAAKPAATPVSLAVGRSVEEVERALGKPESVVTLGSETIYVYRAPKVTLVDGKVTDVQ